MDNKDEKIITSGRENNDIQRGNTNEGSFFNDLYNITNNVKYNTAYLKNNNIFDIDSGISTTETIKTIKAIKAKNEVVDDLAFALKILSIAYQSPFLDRTADTLSNTSTSVSVSTDIIKSYSDISEKDVNKADEVLATLAWNVITPLALTMYFGIRGGAGYKFVDEIAGEQIVAALPIGFHNIGKGDSNEFTTFYTDGEDYLIRDFFNAISSITSEYSETSSQLSPREFDHDEGLNKIGEDIFYRREQYNEWLELKRNHAPAFPFPIQDYDWGLGFFGQNASTNSPSSDEDSTDQEIEKDSSDVFARVIDESTGQVTNLTHEEYLDKYGIQVASAGSLKGLLNSHKTGPAEEAEPQAAQAQAEAEYAARLKAAQEWAKVQQEAEARTASVEAYGSLNQFIQAVENGDAVEIARTYAHYMTAQDTNARKQGYEAQLSDAAHAAFSAAANGLDLTQAIRSGDGWGIAGETAALLRDIDNYVRATGGSFLGADGNAALGGVQSALNLAAAIDGGDEWAIAGSALGLMQNFSNHPGLSTAASAVSLAINIANLDDVFATGDAGQIVYALGSTTIDAINTYNAGVQLAGHSNAAIGGATNFAAYLGYASAALQAVEGDARGAAVTAAATTMITYGEGYVKAAGVVLLVANALLGGKSAPPKAHGSFGLDENGQVVLVEVHGNGKMLGHAREFGNDMLPVLQGYHDSGGRLLIDGTMPTFTLTAGEPLKIKYGSEGLGRVEVIVADSSRAQVEMLGALYARDRGDRIEEAIKVSRDAFGNIDFARADAILAGQGFVKKGLTYTFGETQSSTGTTRGTGERHGGGNVGPEGQVIAARNENIVSLPLRPEQLPGQRIGEILAVSSLQSNFTGWGNELFLMSLIAGGGVFGVAGPAFGKVEQEETNTDYIKPLDAVELSLYERLVASASVGAEKQAQDADEAALPRLSGSELQQFLDAHWDKLLAAGNPFTDLPASSAYYYRNQAELIGYGRLLPDGSKALAAPDSEAWWQNWDRLLFTSSHSASTDSASLAEAGLGLINASSYSGRAVTASQWQAAQDVLQKDISADASSGTQAKPPALPPLPPLPPAVEQGAFFLTPQDSTLRFLDSALLQEAGNAYADSASALRFAGFGESQHGRVWRDANGDIRFEVEPGFVGTASFLYQVQTSQGEIITRRALVTSGFN